MVSSDPLSSCSGILEASGRPTSCSGVLQSISCSTHKDLLRKARWSVKPFSATQPRDTPAFCVLCYLPTIMIEENKISAQDLPRLLICPLSKGCEGLFLISLRGLRFLCRLKLSLQAQTQANLITLPHSPPLVQDFSYKKMFLCRLKSSSQQAKALLCSLGPPLPSVCYVIFHPSYDA